jgi:stage II sporulation protein GA (sporulation sigma-E factor processing peptidase)
MTILLSVAGYMRERKNIMFIILSSAIATVYSILMVFFENSKVIFNWPMKMILSFVMVIVAFRPKTIKSFLKVLLCFYVVTFVFAGLAIAIIFMWGQTSTSVGGIMYFRWSAPIKYLLIVAMVGFWSLKKFIKNLQKKKVLESYIIDLNVSICGKKCTIPALLDTGNELKDPISGESVIVVESNKLTTVLSDEFVCEITKGQECMWDNVINLIVGTDLAEKFRLIPFRSLGCEHGLLPAVKSDYIEYIDNSAEEKNCRYENVILCLTLQKLSNEQTYFALVGSCFNENLKGEKA